MKHQLEKQLEQRLKELRDQFESGQKMMAELESKQASLRDTLLRISGAIQVLEEIIANESNVVEAPEQEVQNQEEFKNKKEKQSVDQE